MSDVPSQILPEILRRLPAHSLLRLRATCKSWRRIIDDPSFVRSHSNAQCSSTNLLFRNSNGTRLFSFSWDSLDINRCAYQNIQITPVKVLAGVGFPRLPSLPVASCNGLFLISDRELKKTWAIWNPLTREFHKVPEPKARLQLAAGGLGYDPVADDYKVVRIVNDPCRAAGGTPHQTLVYSLKQDSWTMAKSCPSDFLFGKGVYCNGSLYWFTRGYIMKLDLATENYRKLPLPPAKLQCNGYLHNFTFNVLGGFLAFSCSRQCDCEVWLMKEIGRWTKLFSFRDQPVTTYLDGFWSLRPIAYWEDKGQIVFENQRRFLWWDIAKCTVKVVTIPRLEDFCYSVEIWPGSLFRLPDRVADGTKAGAKRKRTTIR